jgi:phage recombination protein Bet
MKEQPTTEIVSVPQDEKGTIEIVPFGTDERIRLSVSMVQKMIAVPTRTGKIPDATACIKFMMLCRARHLNPFEGDAFMLGYDTQSGPQFSLITAHQVFLKRAEASPKFNGMESGVIVRNKMPQGTPTPLGEKLIEEREGDLVYDDEILIGGWAKLYRKDREKPFYRRLKLSTFNTNRSRWEKDPAGMIVKCAEADALRCAFPTHLGGLYLEEETPPIDVGPVIERAKVPKISAGNSVQAQAVPTPGEKEPDQPGSPAETPSPKKKPVLKRKKNSPSNDVPPFQRQMLERLKLGHRSPEDLIKVAVAYQWCDPDEVWPLPEDKLELFLDPENFGLLMEEMDKLPSGVI